MSNKSCQCGSCGHENIDECYTRQCGCCLTDHQGAFGKNRWFLVQSCFCITWNKSTDVLLTP